MGNTSGLSLEGSLVFPRIAAEGGYPCRASIADRSL
jgi:hypothetical protein